MDGDTLQAIKQDVLRAHGPLWWHNPAHAAGWITPQCDCGWEGRPVCGELDSHKAYATHVLNVFVGFVSAD